MEWSVLIGAVAAAAFGAVGYWLRVLIDRRHQAPIAGEKARAVERARTEVHEQYADRLARLEEEKARAVERARAEVQLQYAAPTALASQRAVERNESLDDLRRARMHLQHELYKADAYYGFDDDFLASVRSLARDVKYLDANESRLLWDAVRHETDLIGAFFDASRRIGFAWKHVRELEEEPLTQLWDVAFAIPPVAFRLHELAGFSHVDTLWWISLDGEERPADEDLRPMDEQDLERLRGDALLIQQRYRKAIAEAAGTVQDALWMVVSATASAT